MATEFLYPVPMSIPIALFGTVLKEFSEADHIRTTSVHLLVVPLVVGAASK
jgi:hypothetical protein